MRLLKVRLIVIIALIFSLTGCVNQSSPYKLAYLSDEINSISIVYLTDDIVKSNNIQCEIKYTVEDIEIFLSDFSKIQFSRYVLGDPTYLNNGDFAVMIQYTNDRIEYVGCFAQAIIEKDNFYFGKYHCDKQAFNNFLENYIIIEE